MLGFFRRFQKFFFVIVTFMIVVSFLFFGVAGSLFDREESVDQKVGELVDGTPLMERQLQGLIRMLDQGLEEGTRSPNLLSGSLVHNQLILSGLGKILAEHVFEDMEEELAERWQRAKNYTPYQHPYAPHIGARHVWTQFSPKILKALQKVQRHEAGVSKELIGLLFDCYEAQAAFPQPLLHQILFYRQQQSEGIRPDPGLQGANLSLFGFQSVEDWFGSKFVEEVARFILNSSCIAHSQGYVVSEDQARLSLMSNIASGMKKLSGGKAPEMEEVQNVYAMHIHQTGLREEEAVALWQRVLAFDQMFQEVGQSVFLDTMALDQFKQFANKGTKVIQYSLPKSLQFATFREMLKFQRYKEIVSDTGLLDLPRDLKRAEEIMDLHPELVYKRFEVELASISKKEIAAHISLKDTWAWEADPEHFARLKEVFPELAGSSGETLEARMASLDSLEQATRFNVDQFARMALLESHPEWIEEELQHKESQRTILKVRLKDDQPLSGSHFLALVESEDPSLNCYRADDQLFYRVTVVDKMVGWEILSFEESQSILDEKLDQMLAVSEGDSEAEAGTEVYSDLIEAIGGDTRDLDALASHRFDHYLSQMRTLAMTDPDQFALSLEQKPYSLISSTEILERGAEGMSEGELTPVQGACFARVIEHVKMLATEEEIAAAKEHLSLEAKRNLMRSLLDQL